LPEARKTQTAISISLDEKTVDAVVRNPEVVGEAVKKLPPEIRSEHLYVEWKKMAGLRDILIHEYFGVDETILTELLDDEQFPLVFPRTLLM